LKLIGDLERISDHAVNLLESAEELREKKIAFSSIGAGELDGLSRAVCEILDLTNRALIYGDMEAAASVEPLEQVIDLMKDKMRSSHIVRLQQQNCSMEAGFVWSDLLTNLERTADHCSNIAGGLLDAAHNSLNLHQSLRTLRSEDTHFQEKYHLYSQKYLSV
jgi:phosphate:Na+ symporter